MIINCERVLCNVSAFSAEYSPQDFTKLYSHYFSIVLQYVELAGKNFNVNAEDIAQDIFLQIWQNRRKTAEIESWENYLFCAVRNRLISEQRNIIAKEKIYDRLRDETYAGALAIEEESNFREALRMLGKAIRRLPPKARMAYLLKEEGGLRNEEIGHVMGISKSVAKQHVQVAVKRIRCFMSEG